MLLLSSQAQSPSLRHVAQMRTNVNEKVTRPSRPHAGGARPAQLSRHGPLLLIGAIAHMPDTPSKRRVRPEPDLTSHYFFPTPGDYLVTIGGGVVGAVAAGDSEKVTQAFQPEGRAAASNSA